MLKQGHALSLKVLCPTMSALGYSGAWQGVCSALKNLKASKRGTAWVRLEVTPDLFSHVYRTILDVDLACERGYLEMEASHMEDGNIYLSVLVDENLGDEDGFGVEPDDYLVGIVAPDGTFVEPLHIR